MNNDHYNDLIMGAIASQNTSLTIVYSTVYSDADQRKHQSPASLAFVWGIHRGPVNSPHKWPVTRKMFPFHDVIMGGMYCMWAVYKQVIRLDNCMSLISKFPNCIELFQTTCPGITYVLMIVWPGTNSFHILEPSCLKRGTQIVKPHN